MLFLDVIEFHQCVLLSVWESRSDDHLCVFLCESLVYYGKNGYSDWICRRIRYSVFFGVLVLWFTNISCTWTLFQEQGNMKLWWNFSGTVSMNEKTCFSLFPSSLTLRYMGRVILHRKNNRGFIVGNPWDWISVKKVLCWSEYIYGYVFDVSIFLVLLGIKSTRNE